MLAAWGQRQPGRVIWEVNFGRWWIGIAFVGDVPRVTGQKGVEGHIPQLARKHPQDAERSSSKHLTLHQFVLRVEWLKLLSWERARLELKFVC